MEGAFYFSTLIAVIKSLMWPSLVLLEAFLSPVQTHRDPFLCAVHRLRWGQPDHGGPGQLGQGALQNKGKWGGTDVL